MPSSLEDVCSSTCHWVFGRGADNDGLCADGSEPIDVSPDMDFDDIILGKNLVGLRIGPSRRVIRSVTG
jgi:hypothetical protein